MPICLPCRTPHTAGECLGEHACYCQHRPPQHATTKPELQSAESATVQAAADGIEPVNEAALVERIRDARSAYAALIELRRSNPDGPPATTNDVLAIDPDIHALLGIGPRPNQRRQQPARPR